MKTGMHCRGELLALGLICLGFFVGSASAAESPPLYEPKLSLTGDCSTSLEDPVADPSCPYPPLPNAPIARFDEPSSIAIDSFGNEYVASYGGSSDEGRIDVFDDEGHFIVELSNLTGPQSVAVDTEGNLYVTEGAIVGRYSPTVYKPEVNEIEYGNPRVVVVNDSTVNGLAIDISNDHLFVAQGGVIKEFDSAEEGNDLVGTVTDPKLGSWSSWAAVDSERQRLYASACKTMGVQDCGILVFEAKAPYAFLDEIDGSNTPAGKFFSQKGWLSIAVDEETGHFFVEDLAGTNFIFEFDENYNFVSRLTTPVAAGGNALQIAVSNGEGGAGEAAFNRHYLFVPNCCTSAGRALAFKPFLVFRPEVEDLEAASIGETEAELQATVDPKGAATEYRLEYVSQADFEASEWANAKVAGQGTIAGESIAKRVTATATGLSPGTSYRFRVFAENEIGKDEDDEFVLFATYDDAPVPGGCTNEAFRIGPSAGLPDCRAYELVTPSDTNGRAVKGIGLSGGRRFSTLGASPQGNAASFSLQGGALPGTDVSGGLGGDPYLATRGDSGWGTIPIGPTGAESSALYPGSNSPDQGYSFWTAVGEGSAILGGDETDYIRYPSGRVELVGRGSSGTAPKAEGVLITQGATHVVFQVSTPLEPNAPPSGTQAVYDRTPDEVTHVVSLLPNDETPAAGEHARYLGASPDGEGIAFEIEDGLYLRVGNEVTYEIGIEVDAVDEHFAFAGVSNGGDRVFYLEEEDLLAFDTSSETVIPFSDTGDVTVVNVSADGSRAYFTSPSVLGGENPKGEVAQAGEQNLYLSEEGTISFVGTVTDRDVEGETNSLGLLIDGLGLWTEVLFDRQLPWDPSRLNPDGSVMLFQSRADLDEYDPEGAPQIYRYDSAGNELDCISCIPTGVSGGDGASLQTPSVSALTAPPSSPFGFVPNLRADGKRAFFESTEALVSTDTDEVKDVYEWEAQGVGSCNQPGGCVYLISSGDSQRDNFLYGHSASGDDVFFVTGDILTWEDGSGTPSVYDARVGGGFAEPQEEECVGEGCRPNLSAPPIFASPILGNSGNVTPKRTKHCPKGKRKVKRKGKFVCVKKKSAKKKQGRKGKAGANRGSSK